MKANTADREGPSKFDFSKIKPIPKLPNFFARELGGEIPADLIGAVILGIGTVPDPLDVDGGGLVVDYRPAKSKATKRIVFAFNERGMWVIFNRALKAVDSA